MTVSELYHVTNRFKTEIEWLTESKYFEKVDSTQSRITQFLPRNPEGGVLMVAEAQTKGTGRQGREWSSTPGGIWFTLALPLKDISLEKVASYSIVASLAVADAIKEVNNLKCQIKWPNDIIYEGKKVAGILLSTVQKFKKSWLLIGVGVNVNNDLPSELKSEATSIKEIRGQSQGRARLIESVIVNLWATWMDYDRTGFGPYQKPVEEKLVGIGKTVNLMVGKKTIKGAMVGIDPQGALLLKSNSETKTVHAGEVVGLPS